MRVGRIDVLTNFSSIITGLFVIAIRVWKFLRYEAACVILHMMKREQREHAANLMQDSARSIRLGNIQ